MNRRNHLSLLAAALICCLSPRLTASQHGKPDNESALIATPMDSVTAADIKRHSLRIVSGVSLAVAVAANIAGQQYIQQADRQYDRYLTAGNPTDMNRYFNRSTTLDRNAGYCFILLEAALVTSILTFFFSLAQP